MKKDHPTPLRSGPAPDRRRALRPVQQRALLEVQTEVSLPSAPLDVDSEDDPVPGAPPYLRQLRLVL